MHILVVRILKNELESIKNETEQNKFIEQTNEREKVIKMKFILQTQD